MADETKPIVVSKSQGGLDSLTAGLRFAAVILSAAPAAALFIRKGDLIGLYDYFQTQPGVALGGALTGLAALLFGFYKTYKRGAQIAAVASDNRVPSSVADIK